MPLRPHHDRHRVSVRLRLAAEGILGARPVLHGEDADALAGRDAAHGVGHVEPGPLLADDDRPDVGLGGRLEDGVDGIADQEADALTLEDLRDRRRCFHRVRSPGPTSFSAESGIGLSYTRPFMREATMAGTKFDRGSQDVGNILALEHVNVRIPDQALATLFYVVGLGLTRDPYLMVGLENMWANAGQQQFHLPTAAPQVLRGCVGLVVPDLEALQARLGSVRDKLAGTRFDYAVENKHVAVMCPWGNRIRCHAPPPEVGDLTLGIPYVEFPVEAGCAKGIAAFYRTVFKDPATATPDGGGALARVQGGARQEPVSRETRGPLPPPAGHNIPA